MGIYWTGEAPGPLGDARARPRTVEDLRLLLGALPPGYTPVLDLGNGVRHRIGEVRVDVDRKIVLLRRG